MEKQAIKLKTSMEEFEDLHEVYDRARRSTIEIKVRRLFIRHLIKDYKNMIGCIPQHYNSPALRKLMYPKKLESGIDESLNSGTRKNSKWVKMDKKFVINMLMDHSLLVGILKDIGYIIKEG